MLHIFADTWNPNASTLPAAFRLPSLCSYSTTMGCGFVGFVAGVLLRGTDPSGSRGRVAFGAAKVRASRTRLKWSQDCRGRHWSDCGWNGRKFYSTWRKRSWRRSRNPWAMEKYLLDFTQLTGSECLASYFTEFSLRKSEWLGDGCAKSTLGRLHRPESARLCPQGDV